MPRKTVKATLEPARSHPERRKNKRLRLLIDNLQFQLANHELHFHTQVTRVAQLQAEVDVLKAQSR
jgi:hypothetical protein